MSMITVTTKAKLDKIANPYRNFDINPVRDDGDVVKGLVISMTKTGVWTKWMARVVDAKGNAVLDEEFYQNLDGKLPKGHNIQLCYGHNSYRAAQIAKFKDFQIDVRPFTDDKMLEMMAYENKNDAKGNMMIIVETVKQTGDFIRDSIAEHKTFKEYQEAGGTFFSKKAAFDNAKSQGVGFKTIHKMLEGWSSSDVQNAHRVLADLEADLYDKDLVVGMPSITVLGQYSLLVKALREKNWPVYWQDKLAIDAANMICDPNVSTTAKILKNTLSALRDGCDPLKYIRSSKRSEFDVAKATKQVILDEAGIEDLGSAIEKGEINEVADLKVSELAEMDSFRDFEGLDELIEEIEESFTRAIAAIKAGGEEPEDEVEGDAEAQGAVDGEQDAALPELPPVEMTDAEGVELPIGALTQQFMAATEYVNGVTAGLIERADDVNADDQDYFDAVAALFKSSAALMVNNFGKEDAVAVIEEL